MHASIFGQLFSSLSSSGSWPKDAQLLSMSFLLCTALLLAGYLSRHAEALHSQNAAARSASLTALARVVGIASTLIIFGAPLMRSAGLLCAAQLVSTVTLSALIRKRP